MALYIRLIWVEAVQLNVQLNIAEIGLSFTGIISVHI